MSTPKTTPRLADNLRLLAASQLQIQAARSVALDGGALGMMAVDAALAAIVIATRGTYGLWIAALVLLALSFGVAVRTLLQPGADEIGPSVAGMREARETQDDRSLEEWLLNDLTEDIETYERALARKAPLFDLALRLLVLAILVELAGRVVQ